MPTVTGTPQDDILNGTGDADQIDGFAGKDRIRGLAGDDVIRAGDGDDVADGGDGNDTLWGGLGNDTLVGGPSGNDVLYGEAGNDKVSVKREAGAAAGSFRLDGGDGNDVVAYAGTRPGAPLDTVTALGGNGNDVISLFHAKAGVINAGAGSDTVTVDLMGGRYNVTLGAGADVLRIDNAWNPNSGPNLVVVTDFQTGDTGDRLDLDAWWTAFLGNWDGGENPFGSGHARLRQSGAHTILSIDRDGGGNGWIDLITFQNTQATAFTTSNLNGWSSDGAARILQWIGTDAAETLTGTKYYDRIEGRDGDDIIDGGSGDDRLLGEGGEDRLDGGAGDDAVEGGEGNDALFDHLGTAGVLTGGAGDDAIEVVRSQGLDAADIRVDGGDGADLIDVSLALTSAPSTATVIGGSGADRITVRNQAIGAATAVAAGDGDDIVQMAALAGAKVTLGAGRDLLSLTWGEIGGNGLVVTDFLTGDAGDRFDLGIVLSTILTGVTGNPFSTGHARLVQSGAHVQLQIDADGGGDAFGVLVTFMNTRVADFTTYNLGFNAAGGGIDVIGTAAAEIFNGTNEPDRIDGAGGSDQIYAAGGNDVLAGGDGDDLIRTGAGDDVARGGAGNDDIRDSDGSLGPLTGYTDALYGEAGNDYLGGEYLYGLNSSLILDGGDGDDQIVFTANGFSARASLKIAGGLGADRISVSGAANVTINAGDGADIISINGGAATIVAGTGNDVAELMLSDGIHRIAMGAGTDTIRILAALPSPTGQIVVTDFVAGAGGDALDFRTFLTSQPGSTWTSATNPFASGHVRAIQSGANTLIQFDFDGGGDNWTTYIQLNGVSASALTAENTGGFPTDGSLAPTILRGTEGDDSLTGGDLIDYIYGYGGRDGLEGGEGNDRLYGGDGDDFLGGGGGDDLLYGGEGTDRFSVGGNGTDRVYGEGGDDVIDVQNATDYGARTLRLDGGAGTDVITYNDYYAWVVADRPTNDLTVVGGDGDDWIDVIGSRVSTIVAGAGDDHLSLDIHGGVHRVSLGDGADHLTIKWASSSAITGTIDLLDFDTGAGGDTIAFDPYFFNYTPQADPFATGHLRLIAQGADTLLQADLDGGGDGWITIATLRGTAPGEFTTDNFEGFPPPSAAMAGGDWFG